MALPLANSRRSTRLQMDWFWTSLWSEGDKELAVQKGSVWQRQGQTWLPHQPLGGLHMPSWQLSRETSELPMSSAVCVSGRLLAVILSGL